MPASTYSYLSINLPLFFLPFCRPPAEPICVCVCADILPFARTLCTYKHACMHACVSEPSYLLVSFLSPRLMSQTAYCWLLIRLYHYMLMLTES